MINSLASGSNVSNIHIYHTEWYGMGITLNGSTNTHIFNNRIECTEHGGVALTLLPGSNNNLIENNILNTTETSWDAFHETVAIFAANYNTIQNNIIYCADDNGIYSSIYGRSGGVKSTNNKVINNTVICQVDEPSAWNYGIQLMGDNNLIENNTVLNCFRGISTTSGENNIIKNNIVSNTIGDMAIYSTTNSLIENNTINNCAAEVGIYTGYNTTVKNNNVQTTGTSKGITIGGGNNQIINNNINTTSAQAIYAIGSYSNILIDNNNITTTNGIPIQFKKQSSKKYVSDTTITNNNIQTNSKVIIDAAESKLPFTQTNNIYPEGGVIIPPTDSNTSTNGTGFNGKTYNITPENYDEFFDSTGIIRPNKLTDGDTAYFTGDFNNKILTINKRIKITGDNPTFTNTTFRILETGCLIENLTINNEGTNQWGIYVSTANNITIQNNKINVTDTNTAYAIYILDSENSIIKDNILTSSGDYLTYTVLGYEVNNLNITNNKINTIATGEYYNFSSSQCIDGVRDVPEIYRTYGILTIYASNTNINNNNVTATSKITKTDLDSTNSIVGIDIYYEAYNNTVNNNIVNINAKDSYLYGVGVLGSEMGSTTTKADNNKFQNNIININGTYFATGIIAGDESYNTLMKNNTINLKAEEFTYGLTFEQSQNTQAEYNTINSQANANYLIELFQSSNNNINNNNLYATGTNSYGIAGLQSSNNIIKNNNITAYQSTNTSPAIIRHSDTIKPGTNGIYFTSESTDNTITENKIITNATYTINLINSTAKVYNNQLKSENYTGDNSVNPNNENVYNNTGIDDKNTNLHLNPLVKAYGTDDKLTGTLTDGQGKALIGHHVSVTLTRQSSGASKTYDVVTDYTGTFMLPINLAVGTYLSVANYTGVQGYKSSTSNIAFIEVTKEISNKTVTVLTADAFVEPYGAGKSFTGSLKDINGTPLMGHHVSVKLTRLSSGASKTYDVVTDYTGTFQLAINLARGEYIGECTYTGTSIYQESSAYNTITVY